MVIISCECADGRRCYCHVSVQIGLGLIKVHHQTNYLATAMCNATLALNKWEGLTLMLYYLSMEYLHALLIANSA